MGNRFSSMGIHGTSTRVHYCASYFNLRVPTELVSVELLVLDAKWQHAIFTLYANNKKLSGKLDCDNYKIWYRPMIYQQEFHHLAEVKDITGQMKWLTQCCCTICVCLTLLVVTLLLLLFYGAGKHETLNRSKTVEKEQEQISWMEQKMEQTVERVSVQLDETFSFGSLVSDFTVRLRSALKTVRTQFSTTLSNFHTT